MDKQTFIEATKQFRAEITEMIAKVNMNEKFDVPEPILMVVVEENGKLAMKLFNDEKFDGLPLDPLLLLYKSALQHHCKQEGSPVRAALTITSGWTKDPDTMERTAEIVAITMEDPDRNIWLLKWDMERIEGQPVGLINEVETIQHDYDFADFGRFQNVFGLEPREPKEKVN